MIPVINLQEEMYRVEALWSPVDLAQVNDQVVRLARIQGHYHWHRHHNEDELFYVLQGEIVIEVKGAPAVHLRSGQMAVIPKGLEHRPASEFPSYILMFEPFVLQSRGD